MKFIHGKPLFTKAGTGAQRFWPGHFITKLAIQLPVALVAFLTLATFTNSISGQVTGGTNVAAVSERSLGLVTVNGGCSGTLLNQFWVLTARHCVTVANKVNADLQSANQVRITASWTANVGTGSRIYDFAVNSATGSARDRDIVLVYLGNANLGAVGSQKIFAVYRDGKLSGRLRTSDTATQYGRGYSTFATDLKTPSDGDGPYRSAVFTPSNITATHYDFVMNANNQIGHAGDSGGPSVVTIGGQPNGGIAGVQSACEAKDYIAGAPSKSWDWATGINYCTYVSTEPFLAEISTVIKEAPPVPPFIAAGPPIFPSPYHPMSVWLGWDGGPAHPGVEVWVSMNGGAENQVFPGILVDLGVFRQPKISAVEVRIPREMRGITFKFILKDGGRALSTAVVVVR